MFRRVIGFLLMLGLYGCGPSASTDPVDVSVVLDVMPSDVANDSDAPPIGYATPEYCGSCHEKHYEQWRGSMHAYATRDPVFLAMVNKGIQDTEGKLDQFCLQCHAPVASLKGMLPVQEKDGKHFIEMDFDNPHFAHGIQCVTCHSIASVEATQNAQFTLSESTYFGPTGSQAANEVHPIQKSKFFSDHTQTSLLCGSCHDVLNPNGARLEATFSEWYSNEFNAPSDPEKHRTCNDCHMPTYEGPITKDGPVKTLHAHSFVGVDQALIADFPGKEQQAQWVKELLQDCAELEIKYDGIVNGEAVFVVTITNINNGHNLPSGSTADRQVWVHLQVRDEDGQLLLESGMLDANGDLMDGVQGHSLNPDGDSQLLALGQFIYNADGEHVLFPWEAFTYTDNLLGPGQKKWRDYRLPVEGLAGQELSVTAVLNYRTFPPFLIRTLIDEGFLAEGELLAIPIVEMESREASFMVAP